MKILGISCSSQKGKSTAHALEKCLQSAERIHASIQTELIDIGGMEFGPYVVREDGTEAEIRDDLTPVLEAMTADAVKGIILATPVYMGSVSAQCKMLIDRSVVFRRQDFALRNKVGGAIAVGGMRNGGQELAITTIHSAMLVHDMIVACDGVTSHYGAIAWNQPGQGVERDQIGLKTARNLGKRVAELAIRLWGASCVTQMIHRSPEDSVDLDDLSAK